MSWYEGSIWQYGWVLLVIMVVFCFVMMMNMNGRCCPKGGWRQRSAPEDDLQETINSRREGR